MRPTTPNVLRVYERATSAERSDGMRWYRDAHEFAASLTDDVPTAVGVLAALSPRMPWGRNKALASDAVARGYASGALLDNVAKADAILSGADPLAVLRGDKVRNFYLAILEPDSHAGVVIDRHAFDIAVGRKTGDAARQALARKGMYDRFARAYRRAADAVGGVTAGQMQAVTWTAWRAA
ncbi:hypothetical protein CLV30_106117 [Haloactinopolyspora alba]|uniref:Uncharacterized protein n=1 Tax=Haloactinopolyspora alba TaxID=648780 RepID=A0A2P8E3S4_9ACTN|nr:hypothetical protein CLV30_106117 [Haloactinopolyspora alba]